MLQVLREFKVGRPQVFAGLMLLAFMAQCLWAADTRKLSDLEYRYIASGLTGAGEKTLNASPFTGLVAAFPVRFTSVARKVATPRLSAALAVPRPWLLRLPFMIFRGVAGSGVVVGGWSVYLMTMAAMLRSRCIVRRRPWSPSAAI